MKTSKWVVIDWTGRELTDFGEFEYFEDGWGAIYEKFPNGHDDHTFDDYFVVKREVRS